MLAEFWRGERSLRSLRVCVEGLPPDGAVGRAIRGHNWVDANYQLADVFDMLHRLFNLTVAVNSEKPHYQEPKPFPRPGVVTPEDERRQKTTQNAIAYIETYRTQRGA